MTDDRDERDRRTGPDPELDPAEEQRVRGLLADLGGPAVPDDVARRLDDTLAELSRERQRQRQADDAESPAETPTSAQVVPLRRRWTRIGTIAAAAVIVVGVGGVALNQFLQDEASVDSATAGAESADDSGGSSLAQSPTPGSPPAPSQAESQAQSLARELPAVRPSSFADDVTRLLGTSAARNAVPGDEQEASGQAARPAGCPGPRRPGTTTLPIRYDGVLSALVVHPEKSGRRLVEVWDCGGQARLATAQVARQD